MDLGPARCAGMRPFAQPRRVLGCARLPGGAAGWVLRGGSFNNNPRNLRGACRFTYDPGIRYVGFGYGGFRVVFESAGAPDARVVDP